MQSPRDQSSEFVRISCQLVESYAVQLSDFCAQGWFSTREAISLFWREISLDFIALILAG